MEPSEPERGAEAHEVRRSAECFKAEQNHGTVSGCVVLMPLDFASQIFKIL